VRANLSVHVERVIDSPPAHLLTLADLDPRAAASQQPATR